jgi:hypothetical protein
MGRVNKDWILASIICILAFALHVFLALQTQTVDLDTYFILKQAEAIKASGFPLFSDPYSHTGQLFFFPPVYSYLVALGGLFTGLITSAKIVQSACLALVVPVVYAISKHVTKSRAIAFIAAIFAAFTPAMFLNIDGSNASALNLLILFLLSYCILRIEEKGFAVLAVCIAIISLLTSAEIFIFLFGMLLYFLLLLLEKNKPSVKEVEMTLFLFFLSLWFFVLLYKKALFINGVSIFWNNIPSELMASYFQQVNPVALVYSLGVLPLILGIYGIYHVAFESKNKPVTLYVGFAVASFAVLWTRILPLETALLFFSINMVILASHTLKVNQAAVSKMKVERFMPAAAILLVAIFLASSIYPIIAFRPEESQSPADIAALTWLKQNTEPSSVILSPVEEGFMVNYYSQRTSVANTNFLMIKDSDQLYSDIMSMYKLRLSSEAVRLLDEYSVDYIFLSERFQNETGIAQLFYEDSECVERVYNSSAIVYEFKQCSVAE